MKNYLSLMILPLFTSADGFTAGMLPWCVQADEVCAIVPELEKARDSLDAAMSGMETAMGADAVNNEVYRALWHGRVEVEKRLAEAEVWLSHYRDNEADRRVNMR